MKPGQASATRGTWVCCSITSETRIGQRSRVVAPGEVVAAVVAVPAGQSDPPVAPGHVVVVVPAGPGADGDRRRCEPLFAVVPRAGFCVITLPVFDADDGTCTTRTSKPALGERRPSRRSGSRRSRSGTLRLLGSGRHVDRHRAAARRRGAGRGIGADDVAGRRPCCSAGSPSATWKPGVVQRLRGLDLVHALDVRHVHRRRPGRDEHHDRRWCRLSTRAPAGGSVRVDDARARPCRSPPRWRSTLRPLAWSAVCASSKVSPYDVGHLHAAGAVADRQQDVSPFSTFVPRRRVLAHDDAPGDCVVRPGAPCRP